MSPANPSIKIGFVKDRQLIVRDFSRLGRVTFFIGFDVAFQGGADNWK